MMNPALSRLVAALLATLVLGGCDMLGIEPASAVVARKEAEGKAVGGACRHAGRAIEDCFAINRKIDKAAVFAGWREMNDYMRENKIDTVPPAADASAADKVEADEPSTARKQAKAETDVAAGAKKPAKH
jgi:hypothetical protein